MPTTPTFGIPLTLLAAALLFCPTLSSAQSPCAPAQQQAAANVTRIRTQLAYIKLASDDIGYEVPAPAQTLLPQLKDALAQAARAVVACHDTTTTPAVIASELAHLLHTNDPAPAATDQAASQPPYGTDLTLQAVSLTPTMLSLQFRFNIACGFDSLWMVFEAKNNLWHEALDWKAPPYKEVSGAFGDFFLTAALTTDTAGGWRLVAAHGTPWCTSRFSGFKLDVLAPSSNPASPRVVWNTGRAYSRGDYVTRLRATGDTLDFRTNVPALDFDGYERTVVYRYQVAKDVVTRVGPIAVNGRGFVEEWLASPWQEASAFSNPASLAALKAAHDRYTSNGSSKDIWTYHYGPVWACHDSAKHFQVELDVDDAHTGDRASYYQILTNGNGYTMMVADSTHPDMTCAGPDLMKKK